MIELVEITFDCGRSEYLLDLRALSLQKGDWCFVEGASGERLGQVKRQLALPETELPAPSRLRKIIRKADSDELTARRKRSKQERQAFKICKDQIAYRELPMKLISVEYAEQGSTITFYFTAETRVDFRELVRDLAAVFRTRIELRQIGVRDEARRTPVLGICSRQTCCSSHGCNFEPITLRMARDQNLSLNTDRLAGSCGRLRCCLVHEMSFYQEMKRRAPRIGSRIETSHGVGKVVKLHIFEEEVEIKLDWGEVLRVPLSELERTVFGASRLRHPVSDRDARKK
ncbi:MAG: stage 0 sporulation protein [bacterium]|nr:stage 0 sporulation protein [bacterium]